ncbi:ParB/RepB/Spo0J family partition protein [Chamaesiphon sp.]|uniref:ParB/RepB/Spo0J family partition protein n=1 Tax=Chamaesiphon sp. TaxID=2814140 RepID=UPI003593D06D
MADNSVLANLRANRSRPTVDVRSDSLISTPVENIDIKVLQARIAELERTQPTTRLDPRILVRSPYQPRKYFDRVKRAQLTASIKEFGVLENLIVRLVGDIYEIVAGECRQISAIEAERIDVPVVVMELSDRDARRIALAENLVRQDLNAIEETWAILNLLAVELAIDSSDEVKSILYGLNNISKGNIANDNVIVKFEEHRSTVSQVLTLNMRSMTLESFVRNRLPLLDLPDDVVEAIAKGLEYTKAKAIARISDAAQRGDLLRLAIEDELSLTEIKRQIKSIISPADPKPSVMTPPVRLKSIVKQIVNSKVWEADQDKWSQIELLLAQIEALSKS